MAFHFYERNGLTVTSRCDIVFIWNCAVRERKQEVGGTFYGMA